MKKIRLQFHRSYSLYIVCVENQDKVKKFAVDKGLDMLENNDYDGLLIHKGRSVYIVIHKDTSAGDIAHECIHLMNYFYKIIGQELDVNNDEMYCYQVGYFVDEAIEFQRSYAKSC